MKIGILTFHWAANHGAILQSYALSEFLKKQYNANVHIIDYYPKHMEHTLYNALMRIKPARIMQGLKENKKNALLKTFRQSLPLTKRFYTNTRLAEEAKDFDILITGSDQIWNPSYLRYGEKGGTGVYFLNFGGENVRRLSVSASFGCVEYPADCFDTIKPLLQQFDAISVRENTGLDILDSLSINGGVVCADPTSLLSYEDYLDICSKDKSAAYGRVSKMILRKQSKEKQQLISQVCAQYGDEKAFDIEFLSMPQWLSAIRDSKMVVTNSFHCVMMCLKLHTPFVAITEAGKISGMNDRFNTLLGKFNLTNRIITSIDDIKNVPSHIDFEKVDATMNEYAQTLKSFLEMNIR